MKQELFNDQIEDLNQIGQYQTPQFDFNEILKEYMAGKRLTGVKRTVKIGSFKI